MGRLTKRQKWLPGEPGQRGRRNGSPRRYSRLMELWQRQAQPVVQAGRQGAWPWEVRWQGLWGRLWVRWLQVRGFGR